MLTTLDMYKTFNGITDTSSDTKYTLAISGASTAIENYCRRTFGKDSYTELLDGTGNEYIRLKHTPVLSITSIVDNDGNTITDYKDTGDGIIYLSSGWTKGVQNYTIIYSSGYVLPEDATTEIPSTLPEPIQLATIFYAKTLLSNTRSSTDIKKEVIADYSIEYFESNTSSSTSTLPTVVTSLIAPYKRWDFR